MFINSIFFQVIGWQVIFPSSGFYLDLFGYFSSSVNDDADFLLIPHSVCLFLFLV